MKSLNLIDYLVAREPMLPPLQAGLYEYVFGNTGVFVRSERPGIKALIPVTPLAIRGLAPVEPSVEFTLPRVPAWLTLAMLDAARQERDGQGPIEVMYHLTWDPEGQAWEWVKPAQVQSINAVYPLGPFSGTSYATHLIEVHSHHALTFHDFSEVDDASEQGKFRFYGVLVDIFRRPRLRLRLNVFAHSFEIPATTVFDLPPELEVFER